MDETNELIEQRSKKLEELRAKNHNPFTQKIDISTCASEVIEQYGKYTKEELSKIETKISIAGRVVSYRNFGKASFAHLQDASGEKIQVYFTKELLKDKFPLLKLIDVGDIIGIQGRLFRTKTDELTVEVTDFKILSKALRPLPEKWHGLKDVETRYRQRYVDLIVNPEVRKTFSVRSKIIKAIRDFLEVRGFIEVETPMMHPIPGGAAAKPFKTHHNALNIDLYLRIAPELYLKRLLVGGYDKIFEINKNFRNEGISTRHNPEFTMLEFYTAYKDYEYLMTFTEEMLSYTAARATGAVKVPYGDTEIDFNPPWSRLSFTEALNNRGVPSEIIYDNQKALKWVRNRGIRIEPGMSHGKILDEIFSELVEPTLIKPTFIYDYPVELSPLAKRKEDNQDLVERFELFIAGREIANAFSELNDPIDQKNRFLKQLQARQEGDEEAHWMDHDFVRALEYAMPPAAGEGIGIDRLVMILTNSHSIRDVILFPQLKPEQ
ncbi:MAG: lysine--tRNA ligase [Candidatus Magnetoovum sp. WYHC-5]|nr:lysine--tRNA ligase [Candidatus Magnetoovum sp. WYHC-5]